MQKGKDGKFVKQEVCVYSGREKEYKHEWYLKNIERLKKAQKERYEEKKSEIFEKCKEWQANHPDLVRKYKRINKDRIRFSGNSEKVLERDNHKCQECGATEMLIIHHIDGSNNRAKNNANNSLENLITLCRSCHMKIHKHKMKI